MHSFFVSADRVNENTLKAALDRQQSRHVEKVLRLKVGDGLILFDGSGKEYESVISGRGKDGLIIDIKKIYRKNLEPPIKLTLFQGIAKGNKMDTIIQKAVEIGVHKVCPIITDHTMVNLQGDKLLAKVERWQVIATEACKQCGRNEVPVINAVQTFPQALAAVEGRYCLLLYEKGVHGLKQVLKENPGMEGEVSLIIGPEGGFSVSEVDQAREKGVAIARLGPRILRSETAGLVAISIIMYEYGDIG
ncbi:MAG: 16S rRNA (uracil(1498)-N(3))-methyltransferase [Syntrophomonadaceae bacterium]|nr:16S rRNA (uracil(1498)-N(3))-methyltransferase [Syntrophomonadaceae bacterium]